MITLSIYKVEKNMRLKKTVHMIFDVPSLPVCFIELSTSVCNFRLCDIFNLFVLLYENQLYA